MSNGARGWLDDAWAATPRTGAVDVEGAKIAWRGWRLDRTELPGMVLVHGFRAHARWWDHLAPHLAERRRVVAFDLSGMGDSGWRAAYSRRQMARELLAVADAAGLDAPLTLVAHSFGAMVALLACRAAPERIARAVILDAHVFRDETPAPAPPLRPEHAYATRAEAVARFRLIPPGGWPDQAILAYIAEHAVTAGEDGWRWKFDPAAVVSLHGEPVRETLARLALPVDYIHGALSEVAGPAPVAAMRAHLPNLGAPVALPACHHHVMIEQPLATLAAIDGVLANAR